MAPNYTKITSEDFFLPQQKKVRLKTMAEEMGLDEILKKKMMEGTTWQAEAMKRYYGSDAGMMMSTLKRVPTVEDMKEVVQLVDGPVGEAWEENIKH